MVCSVCGTRNLGEETRCLRCGAKLEAPKPEPEPTPDKDLSPGERLAMTAREQLAAGDTKSALQTAKHAAVLEPNTALCRLVLGEAYLDIEADHDALREFRRAAELDPDSAEAKEKAEAARRRLTQSREAPRTGARDWRTLLVQRKQMVAIAAGVIAGLLVFTIGAAAIVSRTSPGAQVERAYRAQMQLGGEQYQAGRYEDAARAFEQASRLKPDSDEAKRRLQDALAMAGFSPYPANTARSPNGEQVASVGPLNDIPPMPPRWVGPVPQAAQAGHETSHTEPPPPLPEPEKTNPGLPPPMPPGPEVVDTVTGPSRPQGPTGTGSTAVVPPGATGTGGEATPEPTPPAEERKPSRIVIRRETPRASTTNRSPAPPATAPDGETLRAEANALRNSGRLSAAAQKYAEAATRFREEAKQGGPGAAGKLSAAVSCDRARDSCVSEGN